MPMAESVFAKYDFVVTGDVYTLFVVRHTIDLRPDVDLPYAIASTRRARYNSFRRDRIPDGELTFVIPDIRQ